MRDSAQIDIEVLESLDERCDIQSLGLYPRVDSDHVFCCGTRQDVPLRPGLRTALDKSTKTARHIPQFGRQSGHLLSQVRESLPLFVEFSDDFANSPLQFTARHFCIVLGKFRYRGEWSQAMGQLRLVVRTISASALWLLGLARSAKRGWRHLRALPVVGHRLVTLFLDSSRISSFL